MHVQQRAINVISKASAFGARGHIPPPAPTPYGQQAGHMQLWPDLCQFAGSGPVVPSYI